MKGSLIVGLIAVLLGVGVAEAAKEAPQPAAPAYDFGDYTSETLTTKAWGALAKQDYQAIEAYTNKCIELYEAKAVEQSKQLTAFAPRETASQPWALNDVATCYFIRGKALKEQGKGREARKAWEHILEQFSFAQAWDTRGWYWKVAEGAKDALNTLDTPYDFGDYTSQTLTVKAWEALGAKDYRGVEIYTRKCIDLYGEEAKKQQTALSDYAPREKAFDYWALNDVATCHFILGEALMAQGRYREAQDAFKKVVGDYSFAQCWDPQGWFWKVAVASRGRLNKLAAEVGL